MNRIKIISAVGLLILFLITKPFVIVRAGNVGILYRFGKIVGQVDEGLNFIPPWIFVSHANIKVQRAILEKLDSFSSESQDVSVKASLNFQVSPQGVQNLYRTVGADYYHVLIEPRVTQNFKDETVRYKSVDIAPNREQIRQAVRVRLEKELAPYSIHIVDLLLDNIVNKYPAEIAVYHLFPFQSGKSETARNIAQLPADFKDINSGKHRH